MSQIKTYGTSTLDVDDEQESAPPKWLQLREGMIGELSALELRDYSDEELVTIRRSAESLRDNLPGAPFHKTSTNARGRLDASLAALDSYADRLADNAIEDLASHARNVPAASLAELSSALAARDNLAGVREALDAAFARFPNWEDAKADRKRRVRRFLDRITDERERRKHAVHLDRLKQEQKAIEARLKDKDK